VHAKSPSQSMKQRMHSSGRQHLIASPFHVWNSLTVVPRFSLFAVAVLLTMACQPPPFGEVLLVVDTDVSVPRFVDRLRLDFYATDGTWYDSREVSTEAADWPLSLSVYTDEHAGKHARIRLRAYIGDGTRSYRGEQPLPAPYIEPTVATSIDGLCAGAEPLPPRTQRTLRRGPTPITELRVQGDCTHITETGSVAVKIDIPVAGVYHFEVVRGQPDGAQAMPGGDSTLFLRRVCSDDTTQVACADNIAFPRNFMPRLVTSLTPGTYTLISGGGAVNSPADLTLRWAAEADWGLPDVAIPAMPDAPATPRLLVDGTDVTPATEPQPGQAIDRLIDLDITYGTRRTAMIFLSGECLGTAADFVGGMTCVDEAGVRVPVAAPRVKDGIDRGGPSRSGSWAGEQPTPCTVTPRTASVASDGTPLHDEEICIPGGAFTLGSTLYTGAGARDASPRQVVALEPFLLDRYEVTVGRVRKAISDGFVVDTSTNINLLINNGSLLGASNSGCTFNRTATGAAAADRETMPVNCIGWQTARSLCQFLGGDLPSHAQWEYAARGGAESLYPWGNDAPDCQRAVYGRNSDGCASGSDRGPQPVDAAPWALGDVSPLGVVGLGGSESEWVLDGFRPYKDACWWTHALRGVGCSEVNAPLRSVRGGNWAVTAAPLLSFLIIGEPVQYPSNQEGVRCARRGTP